MRRTKTLFFAPIILFGIFQLSSLPLVAANLPEILPYRTLLLAIVSLLILAGGVLIITGKQVETAVWCLKIGWSLEILLVFIPVLNTPSSMLTAVIGILIGLSLLVAIGPMSRVTD